MNEVRLVLCTFPDPASARQIGTLLVEKQLAACVNLIPAVESIYRWQGKVETAAETLAIFKTSAAVFPEFERELADLHPYDVPEIISVEPADVAENYRSWLLGCLVAGSGKTEMAGEILYDPAEPADESDWPEESR